MSSRLCRTPTLVPLLIWCIACVSTGCGSTVATSTGPSPAKCSVTLTAPPSAIGAAGSAATIAVSTQPECTWNASTETSWLTGLTPASGQGAGQVQVTVAANPAPSSRQGDVVVNGVRAQIRQDAAACQFSISPNGQNVAAAGGTTRITVDTLAGCAWTARSDASWVTVTSGSTGTGPGTVTLTVAANVGSDRSATVTIAGRSVRITQDSSSAPIVPPTTPPIVPPTTPPTVPPPDPTCTFSVTPLGVDVDAAAASRSVSVSAGAGCGWSASSDASWISISGSSSGSGDGTVAFSIATNNGAARTGTLTVAGQTVTVNQGAAATPCSYAVSPTTFSIGASGSTNSSSNVTTSKDCAWTAAASDAWISITAGSSGSGNGKVTFNVAANTSTSSRTGTLTVAGQSVSIAQAAAAPCSYSVSPTSASVGLAGGTGTVSVTSTSGCSWTAGSNANWITIVTGSSGTASGTVSYAVLPNTGSARSGTMTVAGQTVTISQDAAPVCTYVISPTSADVGAKKSDHKVSVTTLSGCSWTASSNVSWISIKDGASGSGSGNVTFTVADNDGDARTGTLTIAGQTFTVSQKKK